MDAHDGTDIAGQISSARCDRQVFIGIQAICIDHEVSVGHVAERERREGDGKMGQFTFLAPWNGFSS